MLNVLIFFGFFFFVGHLILLEGFKKKLKEEFPEKYKEFGKPQFSTFKDDSSSGGFFKGDNPQLGKFLRKREFSELRNSSLLIMGYLILATKVLTYIFFVSLIITFFVR